MSESSVRKRGRRGSPESWSVDAHVGQRVRMRRTLLGMSQEKLGDAIGLTFQQVQKYERGSNRISAGTLYRLSQVLDVPVSFFFDCYDDPHAPAALRVGETPTAGGGEISRREARLLRLWRSAPAPVADEMLSLLSALSPHLRDGSEGADGGSDRDELTPTFPQRTVRTADAAGKGSPAKPKRASAKSGQKQRRRHGAVWDPADIYRASKAPAATD